MANITKDFFISYTKSDRTWAEWIAWQLEAEGYTTILQAWDFRPGGNFVLTMHEATQQARRTILVLSDQYFQSAFTQPEWAAAFVQDPTSKAGKLLPIRVRDCQPPGLLTSIGYIDLVGKSEQEAKDALRRGVHLTRAPQSSPPPFPGNNP